MIHNRFDRLHWIGLLTAGACLLLLLARGAGEGRQPGEVDRALERDLASQARAALLQKIYAPVEERRQAGRLQEALLHLDELSRRYPGEAHGYILKGEILQELGAIEEATASYVAGVRLSGDYIDAGSPLSRREKIRLLVGEGVPFFSEQVRGRPESRSAQSVLRNLYYLQSRLAGGCE